jgi:hypothetical protein
MTQRSVLTTVTTAADSFKLTTVSNVRADLGLTDTSITDDYLDRLVGQCSRTFANECNLEFALQVYRDTIRASCGGLVPQQPGAIQLAKSPLVSVTTVTEDGTVLTAVTDYEIDVANGLVYRLDSDGNRISWPAVTLIFDYKAGWTLPEQTLPAGGLNALIDNAPDAEDAVIRLVKARLLARDRDPYLRRDEVSGVGSQEFWIATANDGGNLPPDVEDIARNYRVPVVG